MSWRHVEWYTCCGQHHAVTVQGCRCTTPFSLTRCPQHWTLSLTTMLDTGIGARQVICMGIRGVTLLAPFASVLGFSCKYHGTHIDPVSNAFTHTREQWHCFRYVQGWQPAGTTWRLLHQLHRHCQHRVPGMTSAATFGRKCCSMLPHSMSSEFVFLLHALRSPATGSMHCPVQCRTKIGKYNDPYCCWTSPWCTSCTTSRVCLWLHGHHDLSCRHGSGRHAMEASPAERSILSHFHKQRHLGLVRHVSRTHCMRTSGGKRPDWVTKLAWKRGWCLAWDATCPTLHLNSLRRTSLPAVSRLGLKRRRQNSARTPSMRASPVVSTLFTSP